MVIFPNATAILVSNPAGQKKLMDGRWSCLCLYKVNDGLLGRDEVVHWLKSYGGEYLHFSETGA